MMTHDFDTEIGEYVEGTLPHDRVAVVEAHMASCGRCRALASDFASLRTAAGSLERRTPPAHIWTRVSDGLPQRPAGRSWAGWLIPSTLSPALAAGILTALVATGTWLAWRDVSTSQSSLPQEVRATTGSDHVRDAASVLRQEISELEGHVDHVDPAIMPAPTRAMFEESRAIIDDTLVRAAAVQQEEPANELAQQSLFEALRSKLALLQEMLALINEMRKGNQEGTAKIVSEMEP